MLKVPIIWLCCIGLIKLNMWALDKLQKEKPVNVVAGIGVGDVLALAIVGMIIIWLM